MYYKYSSSQPKQDWCRGITYRSHLESQGADKVASSKLASCTSYFWMIFFFSATGLALPPSATHFPPLRPMTRRICLQDSNDSTSRCWMVSLFLSSIHPSHRIGWGPVTLNDKRPTEECFTQAPEIFDILITTILFTVANSVSETSIAICGLLYWIDVVYPETGWDGVATSKSKLLTVRYSSSAVLSYHICIEAWTKHDVGEKDLVRPTQTTDALHRHNKRSTCSGGLRDGSY